MSDSAPSLAHSVRGALLTDLASLRPAEPLTPTSLHAFVEKRGQVLAQLQTLTAEGTPPLVEAERALIAQAQRIDQEVLALAQSQLGEIANRMHRAPPAIPHGRLIDRIG